MSETRHGFYNTLYLLTIYERGSSGMLIAHKEFSNHRNHENKMIRGEDLGGSEKRKP